MFREKKTGVKREVDEVTIFIVFVSLKYVYKNMNHLSIN